MAPVSLHWDSADADKMLERVGALLVDLRPFWPKVVPLFIGWMRSQFETEGGFAGHPWAPLSPGYAAWKAVAYPGKGILVATGDLKRAASNPTRDASPTSLTLTIQDPKLRYHQQGDGVPARPLLFGDPLPMSAQNDLDDAANSFVDDWIGRL